MGSMLDRKAYRATRQSASQGLFLLSDSSLLPKDICHVNIGLALAEQLNGMAPAERQDMLASSFSSILSGNGQDIVLEHIDILFDPQWEIDTLQFLLKAGRNKRLYIVWPGRLDITGLSYAEPDDADYHQYDYKNYIDTYAVMK